LNFDVMDVEISGLEKNFEFKLLRTDWK